MYIQAVWQCQDFSGSSILQLKYIKQGEVETGDAPEICAYFVGLDVAFCCCLGITWPSIESPCGQQVMWYLVALVYMFTKASEPVGKQINFTVNIGNNSVCD